MARKKRKSFAGKQKKKSKATARNKAAARKKSRVTAKKQKLRKQRSRSFGDKVSSAYRTVVDTIKGTSRLRNKMEPAATSETE